MSLSHRRRRQANLVVTACALMVAAGCALKTPRPVDPIRADQYASGSAYVYQPLNPTTIWVRDPKACELGAGETAADITSSDFKHALLRDLDTETVRISLSRLQGNGSATIAVAGISVKGESYVLIIDYIKYFTSDTRVDLQYQATDAAGVSTTKEIKSNIPIYAGIGVRIRAEFTALASDINISGLPGLAAAASANQVVGRLTVQTLGITGPDITGLMPILSDISIASIQSAVQGLAAIKAKLYEDSSVAYPKIVGFESPTANTEAITKITEFLYGLDATIVPRVSPNPTKADARLTWIDWFPTPEERRCPPAAPAR